MNTYETMKHKIPEGATHYQDEGNGYLFAWFKEDGDSLRIFVPEAPLSSWTNCLKSYYEGLIKPIPTETTYRYEKVTDSIFDLKEEFGRGELYASNKRECKSKYYQIMDESWLVSATNSKNVYRRIEVTERELFVEVGLKELNKMKGTKTHEVLEELFDSGKFKLVNGKE